MGEEGREANRHILPFVSLYPSFPTPLRLPCPISEYLHRLVIEHYRIQSYCYDYYSTLVYTYNADQYPLATN